MLEWVAISFCGDIPDPRIEPGSPALQANASPSERPGKPGPRVGSHWLLAGSTGFGREGGIHTSGVCPLVGEAGLRVWGWLPSGRGWWLSWVSLCSDGLGRV